ncbi:MAG TPA: M20/M25/M40 family metallo-hydrolase [bacterium]|nr:M20/M25/M40 family metallo-hydrolase [bacterium]
MTDLALCVDGLMERATRLLDRFCRQPSVSAEGVGISEMAELLAQEMRGLDIDTAVHTTPGAPVVVGCVPGGGTQTLLFYNHYDVQPADPLDEWVTPPFEPRIRDGRLYARGATDNKGNIVSRLMALEALRAAGPLPLTVKFLVEGEEETGSAHLPAWAAAHTALLAADACVWEDTFRDEPDVATITLGNKGMCYVEIECDTASVDFHSSYAGIYPNAAWRLLEALATLRGPDGRVAVEGFYGDVRPHTDEDRALLAKLPPIDMAGRRRTFGLSHVPYPDGRDARRAHLTEPTSNLAGFEAGYHGAGSKTVVPRRAVAKVDFRLVPDQDPQRVLDGIKAHLGRRGYDDLRVTLLSGAPPSKTPPGHLSRTMEAAALAVYERPAQVEPWGTGSTPNWIASEVLGVPTAATGVGIAGSNTHGPNESLGLEDLRKGIRYMAEIMRRF